MIPLLVGAAAVGLGAALLSDDKPQQEAVTQNKIRLTDSQVEQRLNRAGRRIKTIGQEELNYPTSSGMQSTRNSDFSADFERIENMIANPCVDNKYIRSVLDEIEYRASAYGNDVALNFVAYYREKLRNRTMTIGQDGHSNSLNDSFKRIDNMLARNMSTYQIKNELQVIELTAENRRDAAAMNKLADYYERIGAYQKAWNCREKLKTF